ncbi:MAG: FMN-dependent NADH-azoreductase [Syntrophobacteraceae bacterium]|nr:FMN-dependent NADH-azoreductase [Syntrophobacteraceae bacterium]
MAKLLHIQASPMGDLSFSLRAARAFVETYAASHAGDMIEVLDLWKTELPHLDFTAASGKYKIMRGMEHSGEEARAWQAVTRLIEHLKSADKILVSAGMWNFSIPYRLKQYLDIIIQPGLTFAFDPEKGYSGLVTGKPLQLILASGGEYPAGTPAAGYDFQKPYLEMIFGFIGFTDIRTLRVEGTLTPNADSNLEKVVAEARTAGKAF